MAETIVSLFLEKLSFIIDLPDGVNDQGVKDQLTSLQVELGNLCPFLGDADRNRRQSETVGNLVVEIRDLVYDAEDILDAYLLHVEKSDPMNLASKVIDCCSQYISLQAAKRDLEHINARTANVKALIGTNDPINEVSWLQKISRHLIESDGVPSSRSRFPIAEEVVVGLQKESAQLMDWVKDPAPERKVMSIIGRGGIGKTTLARKIYHDKDICSHFDARLWISPSQEYQKRDFMYYADEDRDTMSQEFQDREIILSALKQVMDIGMDRSIDLHSWLERMETTDNEGLYEELQQLLEKKRYLVVIDDIRNVEAWSLIFIAFPDNQKGSRIILTTDSLEIVDRLSCDSLELHPLNEDESWDLFCKKAYEDAEEQDGGYEEKQFVEKCGGLPLAIVLIGSLLMRKDTKKVIRFGENLEISNNDWHKVFWSFLLQFTEFALDSDTCGEILMFSYLDLPYKLKSCFLYLGLFPKALEIDARRLIALWVAEGFVQAEGEKTMEDVAEDYLEELIQRNMIQVSSRLYHDGPVKSCQVHHLLRDVAVSEARKDRLLDVHIKGDPSTSNSRARKIAIHSTTCTENMEKYPTPNASKVRSLLIFDRKFIIDKYWKSPFGHDKKMLRVLDLEGTFLRQALPEEIGELVFLQYLGLRNTCLPSLPPSIGNLVRLQTLDVRGYDECLPTPQEIWKLENLRHLYFDQYSMIEEVESVDLECFGRNLLTLHITLWTTLFDGLVKLDRLRSLTLHSQIVVVDLSSCLPSSLIELRLCNSWLEEDPSDVLGSLPNLKTLILDGKSYMGREMFFRSGQFPQLQFLSLYELENLNEWIVEDSAMPELVELKISTCYYLNMLPDGLSAVSALRKIDLFDVFELGDRVKENGEDWDKIKHVPFITVEKSFRD